MFRRRHYKAFRRATWLAIFTLLLQILVPLVHQPAGMALAGQIPVAATADICFAPGSGPAGPIAPSDDDKSPAHAVPFCPICQALNAVGGFVPPAAIVLTRRTEYAVAFPPSPETLSLRCRTCSGAQPRAPPRSA